MRVLLVEDDHSTKASIELILKNVGMVVDSTDLGEDGLEIGKLYDYDIIILDIMLPDMDGFEVLRHLRDAKVRTPVLILSGLTEAENKIKGLGNGADDYLTKPYDKGELIARINVGARIVKLEREKNQQLQKIGHTNFKLQQNMKAAARVQLGLLPTRNLKFKDYRFNWYFRPSDHLAGDMLHIYQLTEHKIACYVLDVSGHGTEAALLSVAIRNQLTASLNHHPVAVGPHVVVVPHDVRFDDLTRSRI